MNGNENNTSSNEATMDTVPTNCIDITDMSDIDLETLLRSKSDTFRCCGCGCEKKKHDGYRAYDLCLDCSPRYVGGLYNDSWGDHDPNYDY